MTETPVIDSGLAVLSLWIVGDYAREYFITMLNLLRYLTKKAYVNKNLDVEALSRRSTVR